ncbi:B3 domain-containing protein Os01g0234100-like isoform X2 [Mangifera indica]|uniref:B3 domain-containing protein Os01g0234100-like isoform X2 n=1 Tax=Mangifera indica TaxID=29780 RepID=UPI001CFA3448|nr:B3 domain-containing protein Os01g0234100-like isoform X2 [Mangifera indica]
MDDPEAPPPRFSLSKEDASDTISYPAIDKQRKSSESELKLTQICDMSPDPNFRTELVVYESLKESRRRKRAMVDDLYDHTKVHSPVIERAEQFRANLEATFPSFCKALVKSNVTHGFWLHLPMRFCKSHMPKNDSVFTLENEKGGEHKVNYISQRTALSGGWKAFCDSNGLNEADVLVFHLIAPLRFKVFIVRANGFPNVNAEAEPLKSVPLDVEFQATIQNQMEKEKISKKRAKRLNSRRGSIRDSIQNSRLMALETTNGHAIDQFENGSVDLDFNTSEGLQSSESTGNFKEVKSIDNFTILVNDSAIDLELSDRHRTKYYELCCSQNSFLHNHLLKSINCKLAAEIITQTVNIAEAIRACSLFTSRADYEVWDKTLKGFELLGMHVAFLRARLNRLMSLTLEFEESKDSKRLKEVTLEKSCTEEEMRALETKLLTLKGTMGRYNYEVESLRAKAERHARKFQEEANAQW